MEDNGRPLVTETENKLLLEYLNRRLNHDRIRDLPNEDKDALGQVVMLIGYSEHSDKSTHTEDYQKILELLLKSRDENVVDTGLESIYNTRLADTINTYQRAKDDLFRRILGGTYKQYEYLIKQLGKEAVAEQLRESRFADVGNKRLVEQYRGVENCLVMFTNWALKLSPEHLLLKVESDPDEVLRAYASIIENPARQSIYMNMIEPEYETFPLKWLAMSLPVPLFRQLYRRHKAGHNLDDFIIQYVDKDIKSVVQKFDEHILPPFAERAILLHESVHAYESKLYAASICTCLPLIEGTILRFADYYQRLTGSIFDFRDGKKWLRLSTGSAVKDFTIGELLKKSAFASFFDQAFIDYFCDELYNERNPILHGQETKNLTHLNAAKKILTFSYVSEVMDDFIKQQFFDDMDELLTEDLFQKLINRIPFTDDDRALLATKTEQRRLAHPWLQQ